MPCYNLHNCPLKVLVENGPLFGSPSEYDCLADWQLMQQRAINSGSSWDSE